MTHKYFLYPISLIPLFFLLTSGALTSKIDFRISLPSVTKSVDGNYDARFTVHYSGVKIDFFSDVPLYISNDSIIIQGLMSDNTFREKGILNSQITIDLNNNGTAEDVFKVVFRANRYFIGDQPLEVLISPYKFSNYQVLSYFTENRNVKFNRIGKNGIPFTLHTINLKNKSATVGIGNKNIPLALLEFPNPGIQIFVLKITDSLSTKPSFSIAAGKNHVQYTNEPVFESQGDDMVASVWVVEKLGINEKNETTYTIPIKNISPPFAVHVLVNFSMENGIRLRTQPSITIVEK